MSDYFTYILKSFTTTFEGLSVALANFLAPPVTIQYPNFDLKDPEVFRKFYKGPLAEIPKNYRGILEVDLTICTACKLCAKACPIDCIVISDAKCEKTRVQGLKGKEQVKTRTPAMFNIDLGKCMFCGLCVMPCPTGAIRHTQNFEFNQSKLENLVKRFINESEKARLEEIGRQVEAAEAAKKAAKKADEDNKGKDSERKEGNQ